jgi:hypothetical protein
VQGRIVKEHDAEFREALGNVAIKPNGVFDG